jgi:hypothetical protein
MARFVIGRDLYDALGGHLSARAEQVGFFLAEARLEERAFALCEWRPVPPEGLEYQSDFHVSLTDEMLAEVIKWAWDSGLSLIEAHSHGQWGPAKFSPSDLWGFEDWVPHLWWRLQGRPYAALVTTNDTFDAIAWIEGPVVAEQVDALLVDQLEHLFATGRTLREGRDRKSDDEPEVHRGT